MKKEIFIAAAVIFSGYAQAQEDTAKTLDEVIVTATKSEVKQSQTGKVVSVIDQATLQRNAGKTLTEILNYQVGLFIVGANNSPGANQEVYLRGAATGNTLILIDGVRVGDPSQINNSFDLDDINTSQIERIEILKGAQSTLWGSDGVAGVINIITKKGGSKKITPSVMLSYGSYDTYKANAGINGTLKNFTYNLNYNHTDSKGFSSAYDSTGNQNFDKDGLKQDNFQANIGYQFTPKVSVRGMSNYSKYKADLDAGAFEDDKDYTNTNYSFVNTLEMMYKTKGISLHFSNSFIHTKRLYNDDSASIGGFVKYARGRYLGRSYVSDLYGNFTLASKLSLVSGLQYTALNSDQYYLSISSYGPYTTGLGDSAKVNNFSAYASLLLLDQHGFNAETGIRHNHNSLYGNNTTYSFNPSYNIDENTRVFVNISSAYKIPSIYQLYDGSAGNKNLKPEESTNYEIGVQSLSNNKKNSLRFVAFKRDIKNVIVYYTDINYNSRYINRDQQNDYGFEVESNISIGKIGNWVNNFTYIDGQGNEDNIKVNNLYRRPNFTFNSTLTLQPCKHLTLMPSFRFVGTRLKGEYDPGPAMLPQYYTLDFYTSYRFTKQLSAFLDLRNITDQKYFDVPGYNSRRANYTVGISANF
ncbi:MAG: TonB-dependent receptor [Bacteroidota bacterium]|nr:TonB-dependent receptor [Bacteroidota bacterium]